MAELLADAPLGALAGLMALPLAGMLLLGTYIAFSMSRRNKKSKMKHGGLPKDETFEAPPEEAMPTADGDITQPADPRPLGMGSPPTSEGPPATEPPEPSSADLTVPTASPAMPAVEQRLSLSVLSDKVAAESMPESNNPTPSAAPASPDPPASQPPAPAEPVELLRLLRDPEQESLIVEIGGQRYSKLRDISDKKIGQFVLNLAGQLLAFTSGAIMTAGGMKSVGKPAVRAVPPPLVKPPVQPPISPAQPAPPVVEAEFLASLQAQAPEPGPSARSGRGLFGFGAKKPQKAAKPESIPGLNLADEINDIVQRRLTASPLAATTAIEITADPGGGIRIRVNDSFFSSPDDVPQPEARDLIKASIKAWERS